MAKRKSAHKRNSKVFAGALDSEFCKHWAGVELMNAREKSDLKVRLMRAGIPPSKVEGILTASEEMHRRAGLFGSIKQEEETDGS